MHSRRNPLLADSQARAVVEEVVVLVVEEDTEE